jgi:hypothetical protein
MVSNLLLVKILCIVTIISVLFLNKEKFSTVEATLLNENIYSDIVKYNNEKYNAPCVIPTSNGEPFEFAYKINDKSVPLWYKTDDPQTCALELSGDDLVNNIAKCSSRNNQLNDQRVVESITFNDGNNSSKKCEVKIKSNLSRDTLETYLQRQKSYRQKVKQQQAPSCAPPEMQKILPGEEEQSISNSFPFSDEPTFVWSPSRDTWTWMYPYSGSQTPYSQLGISDTRTKSITFWIYFTHYHWSWRNIFHITNSAQRNCCSPGDRVPSVWLWPGTGRLHICHDTMASVNENFNPEGIVAGVPSFVALIWNERTLTVYIDNRNVGSYTYTGDLVEPSSSAVLLTPDPWHDAYCFQIKDLKFWNKPLEVDDLRQINKIVDATWVHPRTQGISLDMTNVTDSYSYGSLGITSHRYKSFTFKAYINYNNSWRNIFQMNNYGRDWGSRGDRLPSVWVWPGANKLYIAHDTTWAPSEGYTAEELPMNRWVHIALVWNNRVLNVYYDGSNMGSYTYNGDLIEPVSSATLYIGSPWWRMQSLWLQNFRIWNRALTADEINRIKSE